METYRTSSLWTEKKRFSLKKGRSIGVCCLLLLFFLFAGQTYALQPEPNAVFARVIDSGPALSVAVVMPNGHYMIYVMQGTIREVVRKLSSPLRKSSLRVRQ